MHCMHCIACMHSAAHSALEHEHGPKRAVNARKVGERKVGLLPALMSILACSPATAVMVPLSRFLVHYMSTVGKKRCDVITCDGCSIFDHHILLMVRPDDTLAAGQLGSKMPKFVIETACPPRFRVLLISTILRILALSGHFSSRVERRAQACREQLCFTQTMPRQDHIEGIELFGRSQDC